MYKKISFGLLAAVFFLFARPVAAQPSATLSEQIASLLSQIAALQQQITTLSKYPSSVKQPEPTLSDGGAMRGVWFNPETVQGTFWLRNYDDSTIVSRVKNEFKALKYAGFSHVTIFAVANKDLSWPTPTNRQMERIVNAVDDANEAGLKVILYLSTPCSVPNKLVDNDPSRPFTHVGGHKTGDVVNGRTLYWDVAYCSDNHIADAKSWYRTIIGAVENDIADSSGISVIEIAGFPGVPFGTELNIFGSYFRYLTVSKKYIGELVPYVRSRTDIPIGVNLLPSDTTGAYLDNFLAAVPATGIDYVDFTFNPDLSLSPILQRLPASKVIISDFKATDHTQMTISEILNHHITLVKENNLAGWWYWLYKDQPGSIGVRQSGHVGATAGGWKPGVLRLLQEPMPTGSSEIRVLSPNGGETFYTGNRMSVVWKTRGVDNERVGIQLRSECATTAVITADTANDGQYSWTIPSSVANDKCGYKVYIGMLNVKSPLWTSDESDDWFEIVRPPVTGGDVSIDVTAPAGGEVYTVGQDVRVSFHLKAPLPDENKVSFGLYKVTTSGDVFINQVSYMFSPGENTILINPTGGSAYSSDGLTGSFRFKVTADGQTPASEMSGVFTISAPTKSSSVLGTQASYRDVLGQMENVLRGMQEVLGKME